MPNDPYTPVTHLSPANDGSATDMTVVVDTVEAGLTTVAQFSIDAYGGDPTGATFSDAAAAAVAAAGGTGPWIMELGQGAYKFASPILNTAKPSQGIVGPGKGECFVTYTGSGDFIRAYDSAAFSAHLHPGIGGRFTGFTIDGASASAGACGMHVGDLASLVIDDIRIQNFNKTGSKGLWLDNTVTWTEQARITVDLSRNTTGATFDVHGSYNSFEKNTIKLVIEADANQDGVVFINGAGPSQLDLDVIGNFNTGSTNTGTAFKIGADGTNVQLTATRLFFRCETDGATGVAHTTFNIGSTSNLITSDATFDFGVGGSIPWVAGNARARTAAHGRIAVDSNLGQMAFYQAQANIGVVGLSKAFFDNVAGIAYIGSGNIFSQQLIAGSLTMAFDAAALSAMAGQAGVYYFLWKQPSSGSCVMSYPASVSGGPVLSTVPNTTNVVCMVTADHSSFQAWLER